MICSVSKFSNYWPKSFRYMVVMIKTLSRCMSYISLFWITKCWNSDFPFHVFFKSDYRNTHFTWLFSLSRNDFDPEVYLKIIGSSKSSDIPYWNLSTNSIRICFLFMYVFCSKLFLLSTHF